ncbi:MAG: YeeE/YedE family protein, partial [Gammaproteobacteria bacterium]|nr:YeeE/YedE family protein [Gammaproteobacteria bacterium]
MKFGTRWPPVPAGILIGVSMLLAWLVAGRGIGASGAMTRFVAWVQHGLFPTATEQSEYFGRYFADGAHPLNDYVVFILVGLLAGALVAALLGGRLRLEVLRGPRASIPMRLSLAVVGGVLCGFAARLARGCTSGQGLVGGAELSVGAWVFLMCIFA